MANRRLSIAELLNPIDELTPTAATLTPTPSFSYTSLPAFGRPEVRNNIRLNRKTCISTLYVYNDVSTYIEYPSTNYGDPVGYLFRQDSSNWQNPARNFAYSLGQPSGRTQEGCDVYCNLLVGEDGSEVPCTKKHYTCQGSKICPLADLNRWSEEHFHAEPEDIRKRCIYEREYQSEISDPNHDVFAKTAAFLTALRKVGCRAPKCEETMRNSVEEQEYLLLAERQAQASRGYISREEYCHGRMFLEYDQDDKPFIRCEHYNIHRNRDHFVQYLDDSYDIDYLEAHFNEDFEELERIERMASRLGYGPLAECSTVVNFTSQRLCCPNRSHLKHYIDQIKEETFPYGTGWAGVLHLKMCQDANLPPSEWYIRRILEFPADDLDVHEEDEPGDASGDTDCLRIIVCMSQDGSRRMQSARYLQSDIGFKRVVGFHEFEIASMDKLANTTIIFCRVFLNRQTAAAHACVFAAIEEIVKEDTGRFLRWRHIHGSDIEETDNMILQWTGDQHGGQAKGLGLHLQNVAKRFPEKYDLHQPDRLLRTLSPYEHLRRLFRLCVVHGMRNIRKITASEQIRNLMRSLICMEHRDWDGTIAAILRSGNKAAVDWVNDKIRSKFAFEAMCWKKSFIPKLVWKAGEKESNLVESGHSDVNLEGVHCTLVGGIKKGQHFDNLKMKTLLALEQGGIRPSYRSGHISENATKNLKRKLNAHHQMLEGQDSKIETHNKKLQAANEKVSNAHHKVQECAQSLEHAGLEVGSQYHQRASDALAKAKFRLDQAESLFVKQVDSGRSLVGTGSGKIGIYLPGTR
ncbi:hypothetical protein BDZ97DRAFT_2078861 [Flammula alnicola]|nr:hypothetical protein BDZ97DRAFT_2078861 [Flammula alnicola]